MKTYLPTLVLIGKSLLVYCIKHNVTIRQNLSPEGEAAFDALLETLQVLIVLAEQEIPTGV